MENSRVGRFYSLRTQLTLGAILLLAISLGLIGYFLINHQKSALKKELEKTIALQGRNIAMSCEKALLREDPEFELYPLVKRIHSSNGAITSLTIIDSESRIQASLKIQDVGKPYVFDPAAYTSASSLFLVRDEVLLQNGESYLFRTPVLSLGKNIGYVLMEYSKEDLVRSTRKAMSIILYISGAVFALGMILSLLLFKRISRPMDVMVEAVDSLAKGDLDTRIHMTTRNEFRTLASAFNNMAGRLKEVQKDLVEKELMDKELAIAHDIQSTLIPTRISEPDGYQIALHYEAAKQVGGDYVDVMPVDSERLALVMADVSGKGIPGLVVMAMLKIMVHDLLEKEESPGRIIVTLNRSLMKNIKRNMFVTMFLGILDVETGRLVFSNAGHNPPVIYTNSHTRCTMEKLSGPPLGLFAGEVFADRITNYGYTLSPGDLVLLYTDGLTEAMNPAGELFGKEKLLEICSRYSVAGAKDLLARLVTAERAFRGTAPQADDLTLLALSATGTRGEARAMAAEKDFHK